MLKEISWSEYWIAVVGIVAIYYIIIIVLFFRSGLLSAASLKSPRLLNAKAANPPSPIAAAVGNKTAAASENVPSSNSHMDRLVDEVLAFLEGIAGRSFIKEEIIMGLQVILREHKFFEGNPYQEEINALLQTETENYCSVHLSESDLVKLWKG